MQFIIFLISLLSIILALCGCHSEMTDEKYTEYFEKQQNGIVRLNQSLETSCKWNLKE